MSEIFSWLKRAELEKRKSLANVASDPVEVFIQEEGKDGLSVNSATPVIAPTTIEVVENARFSLDAAGSRVKMVLDPLTLAGEQYRLLRSKLVQIQKHQGIKTLLVTSSLPFEGKTFTACCLAGVFAQEVGKRILLIEADLRRPRIERELGLNGPASPAGLAEVLRGERKCEDVLLKAAENDLYVLPAGTVPDDPAELLSSPHLERTIRSLAQIFDWIVIDSPPVAAMADAPIIAPLCDAVLLVVHLEKTSAKVVMKTIQQIGQNRICGVVLNRGKHLRQSKYYYHYYHRNVNGS